MRNVRLDWLAAEALNELPPCGTAMVQNLLDEVAEHRDWWPAPGGEEVADAFGSTCWIVFVAYLDGIEVRDIGWLS